jgi:hypothetical protein
MNRTKLFVVTIAVLVAAALLAVGFYPVEKQFSARQTNEFSVEVPMEQTRRILVRKNILPEIVALSDLEIIDQKIVDAGGKASLPEKPIRSALRNVFKRASGNEASINDEDKADFAIRLEMQVTVVSKSGPLADQQLVLNQAANVTPKSLRMLTTLDSPAGILQDYTSEMNVTGAEMSRVESTVELDVTVGIGWLLQAYVQKRVDEAAVNSLADQEQVIRKKLSEFADSSIVTPTLPGS